MTEQVMVAVVYGTRLEEPPALDSLDLAAIRERLAPGDDYYEGVIDGLLANSEEYNDDDLNEVLTCARFRGNCGFLAYGNQQGLFVYSERVLEDHDAVRYAWAVLDMPADDDRHLRRRLEEFCGAIGIPLGGDVGWYLLSERGDV